MSIDNGANHPPSGPDRGRRVVPTDVQDAFSKFSAKIDRGNQMIDGFHMESKWEPAHLRVTRHHVLGQPTFERQYWTFNRVPHDAVGLTIEAGVRFRPADSISVVKARESENIQTVEIKRNRESSAYPIPASGIAVNRTHDTVGIEVYEPSPASREVQDYAKVSYTKGALTEAVLSEDGIPTQEAPGGTKIFLAYLLPEQLDTVFQGEAVTVKNGNQVTGVRNETNFTLTLSDPDGNPLRVVQGPTQHHAEPLFKKLIAAESFLQYYNADDPDLWLNHHIPSLTEVTLRRR